jgi:hypothetical protein
MKLSAWKMLLAGALVGAVLGGLGGMAWYATNPANLWMSLITGAALGTLVGLSLLWRLDRVGTHQA